MTHRRLVIVGAGPAGIAAAIAAAEAGLEPLVLDENPAIGGQIYRQPPPALSPSEASFTTRRGIELMRRFHALQDRITLWTESAVWGLFPPRTLAVVRRNGSEMIEAERLILATGAYEHVPPFPGWTLPGVMTPGGAQHIAKIMGVRPGKRAVVAGTGPFLLVVALQLHRAGVKVGAVVEAVTAADALRALPRLVRNFDLCRQGLGYLYRLRRADIPIYRGQLVVEARGENEVREVVVAPCDESWRPDRARAWTIPADTLCVGYGFVPRAELAQLAGCRMRYANEMGGWIPAVDDRLRTSVPGVWVVGDGGGVAGALVAEEEGALAGLAVAQEERALSPAAYTRAIKPIYRRLRKLERFQAALQRLCRLRPGLSDLANPNTVVCRCEELTRAEVETGVHFGGTDVRTLKVMTRLGMGPCQGRMCWPAAARWIASRTGMSIEEVGPTSARPPVAPVCLGDLARETTIPAAPTGVGTASGEVLP